MMFFFFSFRPKISLTYVRAVVNQKTNKQDGNGVEKGDVNIRQTDPFASWLITT